MIKPKSKPKSIAWKKIPSDEITILWTEEARTPIDNKLVFKFYYDMLKGNTILHDIINDVKYILPKDDKTKGYMIAFKLLTF